MNQSQNEKKSLTPQQIIREKMQPMLTSSEDEIIAAMKEYTDQQVKQLTDERDTALELLKELSPLLTYGRRTDKVKSFLNSLNDK